MQATTQPADIFSKYLAGRAPTDQEASLYQKAVAAAGPVTSPKDQKLYDAALRWPALLLLLDSGAALIRPHSTLRQHIYAMFAVLEASPQSRHLFQPKQRSIFYLLVLGLRGVRAVASAALGILIIKLIELQA